MLLICDLNCPIVLSLSFNISLNKFLERLVHFQVKLKQKGLCSKGGQEISN